MEITEQTAVNVKAFEGIGKLIIWIGGGFAAVVVWIVVTNQRLDEVNSRTRDHAATIRNLELRGATIDAKFDSIKESLIRIEKKLP